MPSFTLTGPDGVDYDIDAPSESAALSAFTQFHAKSSGNTQPSRATAQPSTPGARRQAPSFADNVIGSAKEFGKGALEGVAATNPIDMGINIGQLINEKISQATGLKPPEHNLLNRLMSPNEQRGLRGWVQDNVTGPSDPSHSTAHAVGEFLGGAAGGGMMLRGARSALGGESLAQNVSGALRGGLSDTAAAGAGMAASQVAAPTLGYIGETLGNLDSPETGKAYRAAGELVGELPVAGMAAGRVQNLSPQRVLHSMFADDTSASRIAASDRLGLEPSLGLIGNKNAARAEDYLASPVWSQGPILDARSKQWGELDRAAHEVASGMRGYAQSGQIDRSVVGRGAQELGATIDRNFKGQVTAQQQPIVDTVNRFAKSKNIQPLATIDEVVAELDAIESDPSIGSARKRHLPELRRILDADMEAYGVPGLPVVGYEALKDFRTALGQRFADGAPLDKEIFGRLYDKATSNMRHSAFSAGVPHAEFNTRQDATRKLYDTDARDLAQRLQNPREASAGSVLFSPTNEASPSVLRTAEQFSVDPMTGRDMLRPVLADQFELQTRGAGAGFAPPSPETFNPKGVTSYWNSLPVETKTLLRSTPSNLPTMGGVTPGASYNPSQSQKIDDLLLLSSADQQRPSRSRPTGGNSISGPAISVAPAVGALGSLATGNVPGALAWAASPLVANLTARASVNPAITRYIGADPVPITPNEFAPNAAFGAMSVQQDREDDRQRRLSSPPAAPVVVDPNFSGGVSFNPNPGRY